MSSDPNLYLLPQNNVLRLLHTIIRNVDTQPEKFISASKRIMQMLIETGLNVLPFDVHPVQTPVGQTYEGLRHTNSICGVSVVRAGESMEVVFREMYPSAPIGKILIQRDRVTKQPKHYLSILPDDIAENAVLLFEPMLATSRSALVALDVLLDNGVKEENIIVINLLTVPGGIAALRQRHPMLKVVTSAVDKGLNEHAFMLPGIGDFGDRFFGTVRRTQQKTDVERIAERLSNV